MVTRTRKIRWGILGTARIATKVAQAIAAVDGAEVVAVASRSSERAQAWAKTHGVSRSYGEYGALLNDDLDAIYIPLPPSMHAEWTIRCAKARKHVLCEKPLAMSAAKAAKMAAACRTNGVQLMDGTMWVHHPRTMDMLQQVRSGALGELRRVTAAFGHPIDSYLQRKPPHAACDLLSGTIDQGKLLQHELRFHRKLGGGALLDAGWYCIRAALWAFECSPRRVFASASYKHDVDFNLSAMLWFDDNRIATFDCGFDIAPRRWLEVAGTRGSLVCDDFVIPWNSDQARYFVRNQQGHISAHNAASLNQEQCMIERFCQIVRSGELDASLPAVAIENQRICDAVNASARYRRVVDLSPEAP